MIEAVESITGSIESKSSIVGNLNTGVIKIETSNYNELENKPSINGVELIGNKTLEELDIHSVSQEDIDNWNNKSEFSGDYEDLTNKPTIPVIPTDLSEFNNDVGYITSVPDTCATKEYVNEQIGDIETILTTLTTVTEEV